MAKMDARSVYFTDGGEKKKEEWDKCYTVSFLTGIKKTLIEEAILKPTISKKKRKKKTWFLNDYMAEDEKKWFIQMVTATNWGY